MRRVIERTTVIATIFAGFALACAARGDSITLRNSVRVEQRADVIRLHDIADLVGPEAQRHAELVVCQPADANAVTEITVQQVRQALEKAQVHWGRVDLSGRRTIVRPARTVASTPPLAMTGASLDGVVPEKAAARKAAPPTQDEIVADRIINSATLRGEIARLITTTVNIRPVDLRLAFDRNDAEFLNLDTSGGEPRFEIHPLSSLDSDRLALAVRTWTNGRVADTRNITVHPRFLTETVSLKNAARRNEPFSEDGLEIGREWLPPSQAALHCKLAETVGKLAARSLRPGDKLRTTDLKRPTLIDRGNRVTVRCLVGGVAISMQAEARGEGAEGDLIELRKLGERDTFFAVVTGPGEAVVDLGR